MRKYPWKNFDATFKFSSENVADIIGPYIHEHTTPWLENRIFYDSKYSSTGFAYLLKTNGGFWVEVWFVEQFIPVSDGIFTNKAVTNWSSLNKYFGNKHLFHLVSPSPWPLMLSCALFASTVGGVMYFNSYFFGSFLALSGIFCMCLIMVVWWRDVLREATYLGYHTQRVRFGIKLGFVLLIASEVMFFFSWFWAYFHAAFAPTIELGCVWPPIGFSPTICIVPNTVPFINTVVLIISGMTVTWSHKALLANNFKESFFGLLLTILLGLEFTALQIWEYKSASFSISDSVYGASFYMITGFHGFHVICGTIFLFISLLRLLNGHLAAKRHSGFEFSIWYWHFVDVIWIFVYAALYWWGYY